MPTKRMGLPRSGGYSTIFFRTISTTFELWRIGLRQVGERVTRTCKMIRFSQAGHTHKMFRFGGFSVDSISCLLASR
jgi:hypothetical protein